MRMFNTKGRSIEDLQNAINEHLMISIIDALYRTGNNVLEYLKDYVKTNWYDTYNPTNYQRTFETLNSLYVSEVKVMSNMAYVFIGYNPNNINANIPRGTVLFSDGGVREFILNDNEWTQHANISDGGDNSQWTPHIIEYGMNLSGIEKVTGIDLSHVENARDGIKAVENTFKWLKDGQFVSQMYQSLKDQGWNVFIIN